MTTADLSNPLIAPSPLPHGAEPWDKIKNEHYMPAFEWALDKAKDEIEDIKNNPDFPTFENTIEALEFAGAELHRVEITFAVIANANADDEIREIEEVMDAKSAVFSSEMMMDDALFARVEAVYKARATLNLDAEETLLLEKTYKGFIRSGVNLDPADKETLTKINERLSELSNKYNKNCVLATQAYQKVIEDEADLDGVPERAKKQYAEAATKAGEPGKWLIQLSPYPSDIMSHCKNRDLREEVSKAYATKNTGGEFDNRAYAQEIAELRYQTAQLLGYDTYAHFVLDERMTENPETVMGFLENNVATYKPAAEEERATLKAFALRTDGLQDLETWDIGYYARLLKEETFSIDSEAYRAYFSMDKVEQGVHEHMRKLFGARFEEAGDKYPVYHPDVKVFEVYDEKNGDELIGVFYADYYARSGAKRGGAWHLGMQTPSQHPNHGQIAINTNTCNFDPPTDDEPSQLTFGDVTTVYHELGHGMHCLLGKGKYPSLTGTNVMRDFVETPSQLQERWAGQQEVLETFAHHKDTGDVIPADMIQKLQDAENFMIGSFGLGQTFLGLLDMAWHTATPQDLTTPEGMEEKISDQASLTPFDADALKSTWFTHIFSGGYPAGYYGYKYTDGMADDLFSPFQQDGLYDDARSQALRDDIYTPGGTRPAMDIFVQNMGRKPDPNAMYRREGLMDESANDNALDDDTPQFGATGTDPKPS
jgi:peptidyl-dipeptidase Dcp